MCLYPVHGMDSMHMPVVRLLTISISTLAYNLIICQAKSMLSAGFPCCPLAKRVSGRRPHSFRSDQITFLPVRPSEMWWLALIFTVVTRHEHVGQLGRPDLVTYVELLFTFASCSTKSHITKRRTRSSRLGSCTREASKLHGYLAIAQRVTADHS